MTDRDATEIDQARLNVIEALAIADGEGKPITGHKGWRWAINVLAAETRALTAQLAALPGSEAKAERWQHISEAKKLLLQGGQAVLIYNPTLATDTDYSGHAVRVSNPDYVICSNAERDGYTLLFCFPSPPTAAIRAAPEDNTNAR